MKRMRSHFKIILEKRIKKMAFSTIMIGKKIANMRKEKNITQMELADAMGVSYQAVSNWERGNSMPDISKLPELVELLGCSIDELLTDGDGINLIKHVVKGDADVYVQENKVTAQVIGDVAPILKPKQTEGLMNRVLEQNEERLTIEDLISIAPFVGEDYLDRFVDKVDIVENIGSLCGIAPFLSEEALDKLAGRLQETGNLSQLTGLAPFLKEDTLDQLVRKSYQDEGMHQIVGLAPFLKEETLDYLVIKALEKGDISNCSGLYPFLGEDTLHKLADTLVKKGGFAAIKDIAPFL
jgi:transcriptional regulator with XRE-family HTH domain